MAPGSRLQGSSVSGSAAALAIVDPTSIPSAPAKIAPRPSRARRSMRPLPATGSSESPFGRRTRAVMALLSVDDRQDDAAFRHQLRRFLDEKAPAWEAAH